MKKKWISAAMLFALFLGICVCRCIADHIGTSGTTLPAKAYEEEWDVVMEITDSGPDADNGEMAEEFGGEGTDAKADSALKQVLDAQEAVQDVLVAVIDTGLDYENFTPKDRVVALGNDSFTDENGHGTYMAKIIAENSGDRVKIMPIRVTDEDGKTTVARVCQAIVEAVGNGADIINLSMNTLNSTTSRLLEITIDEVVESGITVVVSAGNKQTDVKDISPANVESALVISAVDPNGIFAEYSNYGDFVDYSAPGSYRGKTGTSYAAAYFSGVLAEVYSKGWSAAELDSYVYDCGETGWDRLYGKGVVSLTELAEKNPIQGVFGEGWEEMGTSSILEMEDFHLLTNEEINAAINQSDLADIGYYLSGLSDSDREELLERDTILKQKVSFCSGSFTGGQLLGSDTLNLTERKESFYYEKCIEEYEKESQLLRTSAVYLHKTGYFYLEFVDKTGAGLSTTYQIHARICPEDHVLSGNSAATGKAITRGISRWGENPYAITVWSTVCTGGSDTMKLTWGKENTGYYASFYADDKGKDGRIFSPNIKVECPAYTLMYTAEMSHSNAGNNCAGRGNFFTYTSGNTYTYASNRGEFHLRKYNMQEKATFQILAPQLNASHMNLSDSSQSYNKNSTFCTMYVYLNNPEVTLTVNPNGEKWAGKKENSTVQVINGQEYELGKTTVTNYKAVFFGGGDETDPVKDDEVETDREFLRWNLTCKANGTGANGTKHSAMDGLTFVAGTIEYDKNSSRKATSGEKVTASAEFSGNYTITFPAAPERNGYSFAGWYTGAESGKGTLACSRAEAGRKTITLDADMEFHAEWTKKEYEVSFYNGESLLVTRTFSYRTDIDLSTSEQEQDENGYYYVQKIAETEPIRVSNGAYLLVGWSLTEDGPVVSSINVPANHDTRLYAVWSRPTSGMKQVLLAVRSGENLGRTVIETEGDASVNLTLGLRAYLYQADVSLLITEQGVLITADEESYAEDHAGNKTPLSLDASISALPVQYTFIYHFYKYNAVTECWDYMENADAYESADVSVGKSFEYSFKEELSCATPEGYFFDHAEYEGNSVELPYPIQVTGEENEENTTRTIDLFFYPVTCTLTFDANGGVFLTDGLGTLFTVSEDAATAQRTVLYGACIGTFPGADKGTFYGCTGYYDDRSEGKEYHVNDTVTGDLVLYAQWEVKSGTVRYDAAGNQGTIGGAGSLDTLVPYETEVNYGAQTAERAQYEFLGWALDAQNMPSADGVNVLDPATDQVLMTSESLTLYAQFARTLKVMFHQWNCVDAAVQEDGSAPVLYNNQSSVTVISPAIQSFARWESYGWSEGTEAAEFFDIGENTEIAAADDADYYALYRRQVTLTYDTGIPQEEEESICFDEADTAYAYRIAGGGDDLLAEFVIKPEPNREYYTFVYWQGSDGARYEPGDSFASVDDLTLTAVWKANTALVIYDAQTNGGTVDGRGNKTVEIGYREEIPADAGTYPAQKDGYEFLGWNTDPDAHAGLSANSKVDEKIMEDGVITLYAVFRSKVSARFFQQGRTEPETVSGYLYNNMETVTLHAPEILDYEGWNALGWTQESKAVAEVELCADTDFELSAPMDFYALYEKPVTLTYDTGIRSLALDPCYGYAYHNTSVSGNEADEPAYFIAAEMIPQERKSFLNWKGTDGVTYLAGEQIARYEDEVLCAEWDEYPEITALDRYFTLEEAVDESGTYINPEVLLDPQYVTATDREDASQSLSISLLQYYEEDFRTLTGSADLLIYFQAVDSYGHISTATATVHVVDTAMKEDPFTTDTRFLASEFYQVDGEYVAEQEGGLSSTSRWRTDRAYEACLAQAMQNAAAEETEVRYHSYFTMSDLKKWKTRILDEDGFGKFQSAEQLEEFIAEYIEKKNDAPEN